MKVIADTNILLKRFYGDWKRPFSSSRRMPGPRVTSPTLENAFQRGQTLPWGIWPLGPGLRRDDGEKSGSCQTLPALFDKQAVTLVADLIGPAFTPVNT